MSYNTAAAANQLVTVLSGLSGMSAAQLGMPLAIGPRVSSYVTMGSQRTRIVASGIVERETNLFTMLTYRLDGAEATAETTLMGLVDAFLNALGADMTLAGTVTGITVNSLGADEPEYQARAGKEYREYPILVTVKQRSTYEVNP